MGHRATAPSQHRLPECLRPPASSRTSRDSAQPLSRTTVRPPSLPSSARGRGREGRAEKTGRGAHWEVWSKSFTQPYSSGAGEAREAAGTTTPSRPFGLFLFKKKKTPHSPSSLFTHTHTHPRQTRTHPGAEGKAASRFPAPPPVRSWPRSRAGKRRPEP